MIRFASYVAPRSCKVYTPSALAEAMIEACGVAPGASWLEPSVGAGVFLEVLSARGIPPENITALDLAMEPEASDALARTMRGVDFMAWTQGSPRKFDRIVGNPPYVPFDELPREALSVAQRVLIGPTLEPLTGRANLWAAFVAAAVQQMEFGGVLCFVLPAAWDYADYARPLRAWVPLLFREFSILRCAQPIFDSVEEGAIVILGRGFGKPHSGVRRIECASVNEVAGELLRREGSNRPTATRPLCTARQTDTRLGDVAEIRIGGVTGDSRYFLLNEQQRRAHSLPVAALRPVVTRSRHLDGAAATAASWGRLRARGERVWLFRPPAALLSHPVVEAYLNLAPDNGGCNRRGSKVSLRKPWHRTPLPTAPHAFLSGMSEAGPWLCLNRMPGLTATNTLYTVRFSKQLSRREHAVVALALLTTAVREQVDRLRRRYPGGLFKLEPGDLRQLALPQFPERGGVASAYRAAVHCMLTGQKASAYRMADEFFLKPGLTIPRRTQRIAAC